MTKPTDESLSAALSPGRNGEPERENRVLRQRLVEWEKIGEQGRESRRAALNVMEDAVEARRNAERLNRELTREVGERRRAEEAVEEDLRDMELLRDLSVRVIASGDTQGVYEEVLSTAMKLTRADAGTMQLMDLRKEELEMVAARGFSREMTDRYRRVCATSSTPCGHALARGKRVLLEFDVADEAGDESMRLHRQAGYASGQSTPLLARSGKIVGMLSTHWRNLRRPTEREGRFLDLLARQVADMIVQRQIDEVLRASEERFRLLVTASSEIIYRMSANWKEMRYLEGKSFLADTRDPTSTWLNNYIPASDQALVQATISAAIREKKTFELEHRVILADGSIGWSSSRAVPVLDERGEIVEWFGAASDITRRKLAEEAVTKSEEKYRMLFNSIDEGFCILELQFDEEGKAVDWIYTEANPAFEKQTGYINPIGQRISHFQPDLERSWFERFAAVARTGEPTRFIQYSEAMGVWYDVYALRVSASGDNRVSLLFNDITKDKRREANLAFLAEISQELTRLTNINETIDRLSEKMGRFFTVKQCMFVELADDYETSIVAHGWHSDGAPDLKGTYRVREFLSDGLISAVKKGEPLVVSDTQTDLRVFSDGYGALGIRSFIIVPIARAGEWRFQISIIDDKPRDWKADEIELVRELTARIWTRLERARAEEALTESEARLNAVFDASPAGFALADASGRVIRMNEALARIWGSPPYPDSIAEYSEWKARWVENGEPLAAEDWAMARALRTGEVVPGDLVEIERFNGGRATIINAAAPIRDPTGTVVGGVVAEVDITAQWTAEQTLRENERFVRSTLDSFTSMIAVLDSEGVILDVNESWKEFARQNGYASHDYGVGENYLEVTRRAAEGGALDAQELYRGIEAVLKSRSESFEFEYPCHSPKGFGWFIVNVSRVGTERGGAVVWHTDITARKEAEEGLRRSEERLRAIFEQTRIGIVQVTPQAKIIAVNPAYRELLGYSEEELLGMSGEEVTHPEDWKREKHLVEQLLAGKIEEYSIEKRYLRKDKRPIWTQMTGALVRDGQGHPLYILGTVEGIEERRRAQEQLLVSEERFRQFAENSADVFWIVDAATQRIEYLNPVFEKMWGQSREPLMQDISRWSELLHPEDRKEATAAMERTRLGETCTVHYRIVRPSDGAVRWIRDTGFPIRDEAGRVTRVAGVAQDITDERTRNERLRMSEERYRLLVDGAQDYAIFMVDPSNEIVYWSAGAERVFGWSAEEAIGQSGELIFTPEDRANEVEEQEIATALKNGHASDRRWHIRRDGKRIWVDGVMSRLDDEETGALRGFAKVARDASEQRTAEEALRRGRDELEQRVQDRTKELQAMNETLEDEMTHRQNLEREILEVTERERARISQDLHDSLCQELTATAFLLKSRAKQVGRHDPAAGETLIEGAEVVNRNAGLARDLARGLHPFDLGSGGLVSTLRELCSRTNEAVECRCNAPRSLRVDEGVAVNLYRIAQEAVTNAVKHARATSISISLQREGEELVLTVADNGKARRKIRPGLGVNMMKYRSNVMGGTLQLKSEPSHGTCVICRVPISS